MASWDTLPLPQVPLDPLRFRDERRYTERLKAAKAKTGLEDAVMLGAGNRGSRAAGRRRAGFRLHGRLARHGRRRGDHHRRRGRGASGMQPYVIFAGSGGARMQEGILSLMQLPRTTVAIDMVKDAGLPYIVVLTNPTTGGVTASYAMLGDVHLAEPGALIGFAGPRVIEQTIREKLPEGFQRSEYLLEHGMVDVVVHRHKLRETVARLCRLMMKLPPPNHPRFTGNGALARHGGNGAAGVPIGRVRRKRTAPRRRKLSCMSELNSLLEALGALHPRKIDLSLGRIERLARPARPAAGPACRR